MALTINTEKSYTGIPKSLLSILPYRLADEIRGIRASSRIEEIRIRCGKNASLTVKNRNISLDCALTREEMDNFLATICENSLYAHRETINNGYVTLDGGIRVGICGRATLDGGRLLGIYDVSAMNIRIPSVIRRVGEPVCRLLRSQSDSRGVLIFAPPGEGKTTLLCAVCAKMASGAEPLRVCVVDTRGELSSSLSDKDMCVDILSGYPRGLGIEIATRTMNAQLVVCDEIGDELEAEAIISAQNSGVPFVATAHADSVEGLLRRTAIRRLHEARVFGAYIGIKRKDNGEFIYTSSSWEEADAALHGSRSASACAVCP